MKRDIQINFGVIGNIAEELYNYQHALETIEDTVNSVDSSLGQCSGESADALRGNKTELLSRLSVQKEEVSDLFSIFNDYYYDMTSIITPINYGQSMRVDRNDVWWNLKSIDNSIEKLKNDCKKLPVTSSVIGANDDEKDRWAHNYNRLQNAQTTYEGYLREIYRLMDELWDIHNNKIIPFENKDDEFAKRAGELYNRYTNVGERLWDNLCDIFTGIWDFVRGALMCVFEMVTGILELAVGVVSYVVYGAIWCCTAPFDAVPDWVGDYLDDTHSTFAAILDDPMLILEGLAQEFSDMYETEGLMYCIGYAAPEIVLTVVSGGTGSAVKAADTIGDVGRVANLADNIGDATRAVNAIDNAGDVGRVANRIDDISDISRGADRVDGVVTTARKIDGEYSNLPKPNQTHHFASNKNSTYTPQFEDIVNKYDLDLDGMWNKDIMPHQGRHPNAYHDYVLENMKQYDDIAQGNKNIFLKLFEGMTDNIKLNPDILYSSYWSSK